ncbi:hypothetical protein K438DRAFT_2038089 [Mycena galopus ATCC 62051]|nr:hypothetical protein K438DRAFT_2038089 [Mycena galopus ATCC 62051]
MNQSQSLPSPCIQSPPINQTLREPPQFLISLISPTLREIYLHSSRISITTDPAAAPSPSSSPSPPEPQTDTTADADAEPEPVTPRQEVFHTDADGVENSINTTPPQKLQNAHSNAPPSPVTPEEYRTARTRRRGDVLEKAPPPAVRGIEVREIHMLGPFLLLACVTNAPLLSALLGYLSFYEWCVLAAVTKIQMQLLGTPELREAALQLYLRTVGYARWAWGGQGPVEAFAARSARLHAQCGRPDIRVFVRRGGIRAFIQCSAGCAGPGTPVCCMEYDDVYARVYACHSTATGTSGARGCRCGGSQGKAAGPPVPPKKRSTSNGYASSRSSPSRTSSRAPSPNSGYSHSQSDTSNAAPPVVGAAFHSPLFRVKRAPLLPVFVPSPDGDWLSDRSVLECEAELKCAGVLGLLHIGDVWEVGDESNVGRLVWDGITSLSLFVKLTLLTVSLLYKYSVVGDLPQYLPTLAFPPSYFHRVMRKGPASTNPVVHIDISPWGQEIATNLQLLQDRVRTETPQGNIHNVIRWVHRSSFVVRTPPKTRMSMSSSGSR